MWTENIGIKIKMPNELYSLAFIVENQQRPAVAIITGRGNNSMDKKSVLKPLVENHIHKEDGYRLGYLM